MAALVVCSLIGLVSVVLTGSGTYFILLGGAAYAWLTGFAGVTGVILAWLGMLVGLGELLEYLVTMATVKRMGASKQAAIGAAIGSFAGAVLGLGVLGVGLLPGTLLGLFAGGFGGEWLATKDVRGSIRAGVAGLASRIAVILMKLAVALAMLIILGMSIARQGPDAPLPAGPGLRGTEDAEYAPGAGGV
jgi:uncharacterized protein YqgC (DUF456 family)